MSALFGKRPITITAELVRALGANHAIVLQQVAWWSIESRKANDGWIVMTMKNLSASTGLSPDAVRRSLKRLRDDGYIQAEGDERQVLAFSITDKAWGIAAAESPQSLVRNRRSAAAESPQMEPRTTSREDGENKTEDARAANDDGFDEFWAQYPARRGKKIGKADALVAWRKLKPEERRLASSAVVNYAASCNTDGDLAKDAHRWLKGRLFEDWQTAAERPMTAAERFIAKAHAQEEAERAAVTEIEEW